MIDYAILRLFTRLSSDNCRVRYERDGFRFRGLLPFPWRRRACAPLITGRPIQEDIENKLTSALRLLSTVRFQRLGNRNFIYFSGFATDARRARCPPTTGRGSGGPATIGAAPRTKSLVIMNDIDPAEAADRVGETKSSVMGLIKFEGRSLLGRLLKWDAAPAGDTGPRLLHLGCGENRLPGFVNADFFVFKAPGSKPDWMLDLRFPLRCPDNCWGRGAYRTYP